MHGRTDARTHNTDHSARAQAHKYPPMEMISTSTPAGKSYCTTLMVCAPPARPHAVYLTHAGARGERTVLLLLLANV